MFYKDLCTGDVFRVLSSSDRLLLTNVLTKGEAPIRAMSVAIEWPRSGVLVVFDPFADVVIETHSWAPRDNRPHGAYARIYQSRVKPFRKISTWFRQIVFKP